MKKRKEVKEMATILDGKMLAKKIRQNLKLDVEELKKHGVLPKLAVIMVGKDAASQIYVRNKSRVCEEVGIEFEEYLLDETATMDELLNLIHTLNEKKDVNGILLQSPIPAHMDINQAFREIAPEKDVDRIPPNKCGKIKPRAGLLCVLHTLWNYKNIRRVPNSNRRQALRYFAEEVTS